MTAKSRVTRRDFIHGTAVVLAGAGLAACAPGARTQAPAESTQAPEAQATTDQSNTNLEQIARLSDTKVDVSGWHVRLWVGDNAIKGLGDQLFDKKMEQLTNVHVNWTSEAGGGPAFDVMMAGGDLPDMMALWLDNGLNAFSSYGMKGALIPINDYIDANPYLSQRLKANPRARAMITAPDGKIYFFPKIQDGAAKVYQGLTIRGDWLNEAGMQVPATTDELYAWAKACKAKDPSRYPIFFGWQRITHWLFWQWGVDNGFVHEGDKVQFGPLMPQYAEAMNFVQKLYQEGLIDPNWAQATAETLVKDMTTGIGGVVNATQDNIPLFQKGLPDAEWTPMAKPKGPYGHHQDFDNYGEVDRWSGNVIAASSKSKDMLARYSDFYYSDSGSTLEYYGVYGDTYTEQDGKKAWTEKVRTYDQGVNTYCYTYISPNWFGAAFFSHQAWIDLNPGLQGKAVEVWATDPPATEQSQLPDMIMTELEQDTLKATMPDITTLTQEYYSRAIAGEKNTSADLTTYVGQVKSMGIDKAIEIYQAAYDRYRALIK